MVLINTATKVYAGSTLATKVYRGTVQVWPPAPAFGTAQTLYTTQTPASTTSVPAQSRGTKITIAAAGRITGLRMYRPTGGPAAVRQIRLWDQAGTTVLASGNTDATAGPGWKTVTLGPVTVAAATTVTVCVEHPGTETVARTTGSPPPITSGDLAMLGNFSGMSGPLGAFPTTESSAWQFVDIVFEKAL